MTVRALRRVAALVGEGATVVGRRPHGSPSLADDDAEHARLCDRLWGSSPGRGRVIDTDDLGTVLAELGVRPALVVEGAELLRIGRRIGDLDVTFLANPLPATARVTLRTSGGTALVAWDPVRLRRQALPQATDGHELTLPACGSVFVVAGGPSDAPPEHTIDEVALREGWRLTLPGVPDIPLPTGPRPWTELGAAGFSGVGTYATAVELGPEFSDAGSVVLEVSEIGDVAGVRINGVECGVLWTAPDALDVSVALRPGINRVEIDVANAWMNRLISEAATPTGEIFGPTAAVYASDAGPRPAGLRGPVRLRRLG
jgi:hypothetical protein